MHCPLIPLASELIIETDKFWLSEKKVVHEGRFLNYCTKTFKNKETGKGGVWEFAERTGINNTMGGVNIVAFAEQPNGKKALIIEQIFRVPNARYMLELPAGLRDEEDKSALECAAREVKEETGYVAVPVKEFELVPVTLNDPWKSTEKTHFCVLRVDLDAEENKNPQQDLEGAEDITVRWVEMDDLANNLQKLAKENNCGIEAMLWTFALGLQTAKEAK